jgi:HD superfamily phosphohydrolase
MKKLVLIGNGFDLAHGLKTSYKDFILWYLNKALTVYNSDGRYSVDKPKLKENDLLVLWKGQYPKTIAKLESLEDFKNNIAQQWIKVSYFKTPFIESIIEESIETWVDIEAKYYSYLVDLYKEADNLTSNSPTSKVNLKVNENKLKQLNESFDLIKNQLKEYLSEINKGEKVKNEEINEHFKNEFAPTPPGKLFFLNFNYTSTIELYTERNLIN